MIGSGEAESRAVAGAVKNAIDQARLDAGVNITGLLADIDSADSMDYRQHFMCWHLTRILRPSLTEKLPPAVVRSIVDQGTAPQETAPSPLTSPDRRTGFIEGSSPDLSIRQMHGGTPAGPAVDTDEAGMAGDQTTTMPAMDLSNVQYPWCGYLNDSIVRDWSGDGVRATLHEEPCRPNQCAHA